MKVHVFQGPGDLFGLTTDGTGSNLPPQPQAWRLFKVIDVRPGSGPLIGADSDEILAGIKATGYFLANVSVSSEIRSP